MSKYYKSSSGEIYTETEKTNLLKSGDFWEFEVADSFHIDIAVRKTWLELVQSATELLGATNKKEINELYEKTCEKLVMLNRYKLMQQGVY